ncbi:MULTISPECIES: universal stress protein [unclassified Rhodanobacter]|uniref:universal stress protein n=1 Tax=unclassified Rhodanobacter TaxID=2621553 RepID=UPI0009857F11|nr:MULTISPECIES: universal stress protein [unclassified Rhodanobacter]OOG50082.1 universal stress protein UspA [Rhodanobacter sp. C01]OOG52270.1 universal stress protein UspA [Rhodanobacter sp. C03]
MRDILAYANSFESWSPGLEYAARLAASFDAALTGIYIYPAPLPIAPTYVAADFLTYTIENTRRLEQSACAARTSFINWAAKLGVQKAAWQVAEGDVPHVLENIGNWHDLLVIDRTTEWPLESTPLLGQVILKSRLPCLIAPSTKAPSLSLDCIALAWNGSPEAIRSIHAAQPFLARAKRVVVLRGASRDAISEIGWKPEFELSDYLQRHGIRAEEKPLMANDEDAGAALLASAKAVGANMLVMGAYGRTRFSEWIFGGATRHVLNHADIPVFMRH